MILATVNLFFPVVLAVHNAEEYARYEEFVRAYRDRFAERFITRQVFRNAAILFTTAAAVLSVATYVHSTGGWIRLSAIATLAMTFNGITHCVQSLRKRSLTPGTLSAIVLVLPYSAIVIALMRRTVGTSLMSLLGLTAIGVALTPVVIGFCVLSGYGVSLLWRKA